MKGTRMWGVATIVALSAGALGATELSAQVATAMSDVAQAEAHVKKADDLSRDLGSFEEAVSHYRKAVELYDGSLEGVEPQLMAARLTYYLGDEGRAYREFVEAGNTALEWGDVVTAATAFLDASWIALQRGQDAQANSMLARAEKLSHSPLIPEDERRELRSRIAEEQQQQQQ